MNRFAAVLGALALAGIGATGAQAQSATGTLTFLQQTGVVGPNDLIPVDVRLTLDGNSSALTVAGGFVTTGGPSEEQLTLRQFDFSGPYSVGLNYSAFCTGSFFPPNGCGPDLYGFNFGTGLPLDFTLLGGESIDFNIGLFTPQPGGAPEGFYNFYVAKVFIEAYRFDEQNLFIGANFDLATTCENGDDRCAFSRTVQGVVPEPSTWALMIGGFGLAGAALRRRRAVVAA